MAIDSIVKFLRRRDYKYIRELGVGGCGRTVLLFDDVIDEHFVCKKYAPSDPGMKVELFENFKTEIKLMHRVFHPNVVRIYGYHLEEKILAGYIVMEYVEGEEIDKHIELAPETLLTVFRQTVEAFCHLEECKILHRDIRPRNILVRSDGRVKVIDLGFGKDMRGSEDFQKSITLNWAASPPRDFINGIYDFRTEVYFVGKLFERLIAENSIDNAEVRRIVSGMCADDPRRRHESFAAVRLLLDRAGLAGPTFDECEVEVYRTFADELDAYVAEIDENAAYITESAKVISQLEKAYEASMLEETVVGTRIARCFIIGAFRAYTSNRLGVETIKNFLQLLKRASSDERRIVLTNLFARLDNKTRYKNRTPDDEIPF